MKKEYRTLLFDADGTLFDYEKAERYALLKSFSHFSVSLNDDDTVAGYRLINHELWQKFEGGMISLPELRTERFSRLFASLELTLDPYDFGEVYIHYLGESSDLLPGTLSLLNRLKETYELALITNGLADVQYRRIQAAGLNAFFPVIVISEEIGFPKPDPKFFEITLNRLNNPPKEEVLIIGDSLTSDIAGGNLSGIDTCWFNPQEKTNGSSYKPTFTISRLSDLLHILSAESP